MAKERPEDMLINDPQVLQRMMASNPYMQYMNGDLRKAYEKEDMWKDKEFLQKQQIKKITSFSELPTHLNKVIKKSSTISKALSPNLRKALIARGLSEISIKDIEKSIKTNMPQESLLILNKFVENAIIKGWRPDLQKRVWFNPHTNQYEGEPGTPQEDLSNPQEIYDERDISGYTAPSPASAPKSQYEKNRAHYARGGKTTSSLEDQENAAIQKKLEHFKFLLQNTRGETRKRVLEQLRQYRESLRTPNEGKSGYDRIKGKLGNLTSNQWAAIMWASIGVMAGGSLTSVLLLGYFGYYLNQHIRNKTMTPQEGMATAKSIGNSYKKAAQANGGQGPVITPPFVEQMVADLEKNSAPGLKEEDIQRVVDESFKTAWDAAIKRKAQGTQTPKEKAFEKAAEENPDNVPNFMKHFESMSDPIIEGHDEWDKILAHLASISEDPRNAAFINEFSRLTGIDFSQVAPPTPEEEEARKMGQTQTPKPVQERDVFQRMQDLIQELKTQVKVSESSNLDINNEEQMADVNQRKKRLLMHGKALNAALKKAGLSRFVPQKDFLKTATDPAALEEYLKVLEGSLTKLRGLQDPEAGPEEKDIRRITLNDINNDPAKVAGLLTNENNINRFVAHAAELNYNQLTRKREADYLNAKSRGEDMAIWERSNHRIPDIKTIRSLYEKEIKDPRQQLGKIVELARLHPNFKVEAIKTPAAAPRGKKAQRALVNAYLQGHGVSEQFYSKMDDATAVAEARKIDKKENANQPMSTKQWKDLKRIDGFYDLDELRANALTRAQADVLIANHYTVRDMDELKNILGSEEDIFNPDNADTLTKYNAQRDYKGKNPKPLAHAPEKDLPGGYDPNKEDVDNLANILMNKNDPNHAEAMRRADSLGVINSKNSTRGPNRGTNKVTFTNLNAARAAAIRFRELEKRPSKKGEVPEKWTPESAANVAAGKRNEIHVKVQGTKNRVGEGLAEAARQADESAKAAEKARTNPTPEQLKQQKEQKNKQARRADINTAVDTPIEKDPNIIDPDSISTMKKSEDTEMSASLHKAMNSINKAMSTIKKESPWVQEIPEGNVTGEDDEMKWLPAALQGGGLKSLIGHPKAGGTISEAANKVGARFLQGLQEEGKGESLVNYSPKQIGLAILEALDGMINEGDDGKTGKSWSDVLAKTISQNGRLQTMRKSVAEPIKTLTDKVEDMRTRYTEDTEGGETDIYGDAVKADVASLAGKGKSKTLSTY